MSPLFPTFQIRGHPVNMADHSVVCTIATKEVVCHIASTMATDQMIKEVGLSILHEGRKTWEKEGEGFAVRHEKRKFPFLCWYVAGFRQSTSYVRTLARPSININKSLTYSPSRNTKEDDRPLSPSPFFPSFPLLLIFLLSWA